MDPPGTADDVTLTNDPDGRLVTQATAAGGITFTYNSAGQLASRTDTAGALTIASLYAYDLNANLTQITYPSGRLVTYQYDAHNRLTTVRQNGNIFADQFTYDDGGRLASYHTGTVTHTLGYDVAGRTKTLTSGTALNLTYGYDLVGNVQSISEPSQPTQQFGYDALNRLTTASGPWGQRGWQYSASGDRLIETGAGTTQYQYQAATRRLMSTSGAHTEAFTYSAIGEVESDGRGTYAYNAAGLVTQFTGPNVSAAYTYDPAGLRLAKTVNNVTTYTVRSSGGTVLSEYRGACGTPVWTRDVIYAGGRLLGSIKASSTEPGVALTQSAASVSESAGTLTATISLTTVGGGPLPCPLTVSYSAIAGTASSGVDYKLTSGSVTFNAGDPSGATRTLVIEILADTTDEYDETFSLTLSSAVGAQVGTATQVVTINDDDNPPGISILDGSVVETNSGTTTLALAVALNAASGKTIAVAYGTANGSAIAPGDYTGFTGHVLEFLPGVTSKTVYVSIVGDTLSELDETFSVTLSAPSNVTFTDASAIATIVDNDRPAVPPKSDFNWDGKPDLLWRHDTTGALAVWVMDGTTMTSTTAPTPSLGAAGLLLAGAADFYSDGASDIVWQDPVSGDVSIWIMSGLSRLWVETVQPNTGRDPAWRVKAVVDINADGHPDLLWQHPAGWTSVSILIGRTIVAQHLLSPTQVGAGWQMVAAGDLDQDGFTDVIWHNEQTGDLAWWKLDGHSQVSSGSLSPGNVADTNWKLRGAADFDQDGMSDLFWQNTATGHLSVWLMNGATVRTMLAPTPGLMADHAWRIVAPR